MKNQIRPIEKIVLYARTTPTNKVEALDVRSASNGNHEKAIRTREDTGAIRGSSDLAHRQVDLLRRREAPGGVGRSLLFALQAFEEPPGASRDSWRSLRPCRRDVL